MSHHTNYAADVVAMYAAVVPTLAVAGLIVGAKLEEARRAARPAAERADVQALAEEPA